MNFNRDTETAEEESFVEIVETYPRSQRLRAPEGDCQ